jgi:plasmid stabilization system protein ParE
MTRRPLEFHPAAAEEVEAALSWYGSRSRDAARAFVVELDDALKHIEAAPSRWPEHAHSTRRYVMRRFPYLVVYRDTPDALQIVAVAHGRRRPGYWRQRVK